MANVIPPATESVMSSLPREKAGVGSAISNTVRQVGGALGVAVLGSLLSAVYRDQIADSLTGLPAPARDLAQESVSGAYGVASQAGPAGAPLISAANDAFVTAMHWSAGGSAIISLISIGVVLAWLPHRRVHDPVFTPPAQSNPEAVPAVAMASDTVSDTVSDTDTDTDGEARKELARQR
jgi:DHA2 family multidrug resistance protein-like MFS transporter